MKAISWMVIGLLAGGMAVFLVMGPRAEPDPSAGSGLVPSATTEPEPSSPKTSFESRPDAFRPALRHALRLAPGASREEGKGRIYGRVLFDDLQPAAGVALTLRPVAPPKFFTPDGEPGQVEKFVLSQRCPTRPVQHSERVW